MSRRSSASALEGLIALFSFTLSFAAGLAKLPTDIRNAQRRIDAQATKTRLDAERLAESRQKQAIAEQESHLRSNKVVLADLDIEIRKLQLMKLRRELEAQGAFAPTFNPENYNTEG